MTATCINDKAIHVFFAGREFRVDPSDLLIETLDEDDELRRALAWYLGVPLHQLQDHMIHRHPDGEMTLRPRSIFDR